MHEWRCETLRRSRVGFGSCVACSARCGARGYVARRILGRRTIAGNVEERGDQGAQDENTDGGEAAASV